MSTSSNHKHPEKKSSPAMPHDGVPVVETKHGQGLLARVTTRKAELAHTLALVQSATPRGDDETNRANEIEKALIAVETLLTGDLDNINEANAAELARWLEASAVLPAKKLAHAEPQRRPARGARKARPSN